METIYIGNLNYKTSAQNLKGIFSRYGKVNDVNLLKIPGTEKSRGIAFIKMTKKDQATKAIESLNSTQLDGRTVKVSFAIDNHEVKKQRNIEDKKKIAKELSEEKIIVAKKRRRRRGLQELFDNTRK